MTETGTQAAPANATRLSPTAHALLGLLAVRSWSTYELAKQVERSLAWFWPRTERKVYDEARKLVELGLADAVSEPTGKRGRTVYSITPAGRETLATWLGLPSAPPKLESEALVRVFFADAGTLDDLRAAIDQLAQQSAERLDELIEKFDGMAAPDYGFDGRRHINGLGLTFQLRFHEMMFEWARWAHAQTDEWNSTADPGAWDWQAHR